MLQEAEFNEWLEHPVTKAVKEMYAKRAEELKSAWANLAFSEISTAEAYAMKNISEAARASVCLDVVNLSYEDYETEMVNEKHVGASPQGESSVDPSV